VTRRSGDRLIDFLTRSFPDGFYLPALQASLDRVYSLLPCTIWNRAVKKRAGVAYTPRWAPEAFQLLHLALGLGCLIAASPRLPNWLTWLLASVFLIRLVDILAFALHWVFVARDPVYAHRRSLAAFLVNAFEIPLYYTVVALCVGCVDAGRWGLLYRNLRDLLSLSVPSAFHSGPGCRVLSHAALVQEAVLLLLALTIVVGLISRGEIGEMPHQGGGHAD